LADSDPDLTRQWVETWLKAGPKLEEIRRDGLRAFRYEEHVDQIDDLLQMACRFARPRLTSGLVEQQRLFQRLRKEGPASQSSSRERP
jgi:hypothetical protein